MTFGEKLLVVVFSGLSGIIFSLITNYLLHKTQARRNLSELPDRLDLFSRDLQASILNNNPEVLKPHMDYLLSNYGLLASRSDMKSCFDVMNSIYYFLHDGGYNECPERKEVDLDRLHSCQKMIEQLKD